MSYNVILENEDGFLITEQIKAKTRREAVSKSPMNNKDTFIIIDIKEYAQDVIACDVRTTMYDKLIEGTL